MHFNTRREEVVHDDQPDVLLVALVAEHPEELGESCAWILLEVHVVTREELLEELRLLHADCLQDELVVIRQVKN